jgi:AGZA family xanthine/uracil permease-like MFS transporter
MRWFVRGDLDGFFGLALDNLVQLLLIETLCRHVLGFSNELLVGTILPAVALSLVLGNVYYAWQAKLLASAENRNDVCALPYGINTVSLLAHVFLVMLPAKLAAEAAGLEDPERIAWQAGLVAALGSGIIETAGSVVADRLRAFTPRAALLGTLSGIALGFISLGFLFRTYAHPIVGLATLGIVMLTYFGRVRFIGGLPGGLVAVALGTAIAWSTGLAPKGEPAAVVGLFLPLPHLGALVEGLSAGHGAVFFSIIVPMGLFNLIGSLQNIESAEAAGDRYRARPSLAVNGVGTLVAAGFGSPFPTTIYIGHPGWKGLGARAGYSLLNAGFMVAIGLTGTIGHIAWAIPVDAGMAIVLWIGIVISAQAFQATPRSHAPAVVLGLLPGVAAWGAFMAKSGLRIGAADQPATPWSEGLIEAFARNDIWIHGAFALEQGFVLTSLLLAAIAVAIIERRFERAALWCAIAAGLAALGLVHAYRFVGADTALELRPAWPWTFGYAAMGLVCAAAPWLTRPTEPSSPPK